jgi:hypothetical protein
MVDGPAAGLAVLAGLDTRLAGHHRLDAVRAHLPEMAGNFEGAVTLYLRAAGHTTSLASTTTSPGKRAPARPPHVKVNGIPRHRPRQPSSLIGRCERGRRQASQLARSPSAPLLRDLGVQRWSAGARGCGGDPWASACSFRPAWLAVARHGLASVPLSA